MSLPLTKDEELLVVCHEGFQRYQRNLVLGHRHEDGCLQSPRMDHAIRHQGDVSV